MKKNTIKRGELLARPDLLKFREEAVKSGHASTILGTPVITRSIRKLVGLTTSYTFRIPFILSADYFKFSFFIFDKHIFHLLSVKVLGYYPILNYKGCLHPIGYLYQIRKYLRTTDSFLRRLFKKYENVWFSGCLSLVNLPLDKGNFKLNLVDL